MGIKFQACYRRLLESGELQQRLKQAYKHLESCDVCAWKCQINRRAGQLGVCKTGEYARVSSYGAHMGEEYPLSGWRGSGTIFFSRCNLRCQYCQNYDISQSDAGNLVEENELAAMMLELQAWGCHNINLVSPSHVVPQILAAVMIAAQAGLELPIVYNTGGYDSLEMLHLLDGIIDIYMPDMKYADAKIAQKYSKIPHYPEINQAALREMHRQVGDLVLDTDGIAWRGLLVRHLILPNDLAGSQEIMKFLINDISPNTYLNIMDQYRPAFKSHLFSELNRPITNDEYKSALVFAQEIGLIRLDKRNSFININI
jgi:putative pyruvate formate lyase activating enzyme